MSILKKTKEYLLLKSRNNSGHGRNGDSDGSRICRICTTKKRKKGGGNKFIVSLYPLDHALRDQ